ncbi:MAG TPA: carboxylesterase family protein [Rhodopila sp.]|nr:carboxylesterase family protein [Rhodopila sp.]
MSIPIGRRSVVLTATGGLVATGLGAGARAQGTASAVMETTGGKVRGSAAGGISCFKGIPYAASTAGSSRFLPPAPAASWPGVRDAITFGSSAPQLPASADPLSSWYNALQPISEDCLSLNVWTRGATGKRPVMVWLHGGAWVSCAGSAPGFDGSVLARDGDVVVVTINHRLNLFGYIKLDDPDERFAQSGNAGVLDMVAALRWVRDNAAAFGGDPGNVTIFGQSGGGAKVSALLACPAARGLFHKAIAQSCSGSLRLTPPEEAAALAHGLAKGLGIDRPTAAALQAVPADKLIPLMKGMPPVFRPVLDGVTFPANPFDPKAPDGAGNVTTMFGNAATECTLYMAADMANFSLDSAEVARRLGRFLRTDPAATARIVDAYRATMPAATPSQIMAAVTTDYTYRRSTTKEAALQSAAARAPVYTYVFDWRTPVRGGVLQSPHTSEVPFVFGTAPAAAGLVGAGSDIAPLTRMMVAAWSAFAHTGNPSNPHLPAWPRYEAKKRSTMLLSRESRVSGNPDGIRREALADLAPFEYSMPVNYPHA